jgi:hypothetical protein
VTNLRADARTILKILLPLFAATPTIVTSRHYKPPERMSTLFKNVVPESEVILLQSSPNDGALVNTELERISKEAAMID